VVEFFTKGLNRFSNDLCICHQYGNCIGVINNQFVGKHLFDLFVQCTDETRPFKSNTYRICNGHRKKLFEGKSLDSIVSSSRKSKPPLDDPNYLGNSSYMWEEIELADGLIPSTLPRSAATKEGLIPRKFDGFGIQFNVKGDTTRNQYLFNIWDIARNIAGQEIMYMEKYLPQFKLTSYKDGYVDIKDLPHQACLDALSIALEFLFNEKI
jgi:hypothetical protein